MERPTVLALLAIGLLLMTMEGSSYPDRSRRVVYYPGRYPQDYRRIMMFPQEFAQTDPYESEPSFRSMGVEAKEQMMTKPKGAAQEIHHIYHFPDGETVMGVQPETAKTKKLETATGGKNSYYNYYTPAPSPQGYAPAYPNYAQAVAPSQSAYPYYPAYPSGYPTTAPVAAPAPTTYAPGYPSYGQAPQAAYPGYASAVALPANTYYPPGIPYYGPSALTPLPPRYPSWPSYEQSPDWYYYMMSQNWLNYRPSRPAKRKPAKVNSGWYADYYGYRPYGGPGAYAEGMTVGYDGYGKPSEFKKPYYDYYGDYGMPGGFAGIGGPYGWPHDGKDRNRNRPQPYYRPYKHVDDDDNDDDDTDKEDDDEENYYYGYKKDVHKKRRKHPYYYSSHYPNDHHYPYERLSTMVKTVTKPGLVMVDPAISQQHTPQNTMVQEKPRA